MHQCWNKKESFIWIGALVALFFMDPTAGGSSWCLAKLLHFGFCLGCGIGHSIHEALHFNWRSSFNQHPMGIAAVLLLLNRIRILSFSTKPVPHEQ